MHIVAGNESADVDSAVCSIVLALLTSIDVPLVQCSREALERKLDVKWALEQSEVNIRYILFIDEFTHWAQKSDAQVGLSLVDHHQVPTSLKQHMSQGRMVIKCVDHHEPALSWNKQGDMVHIKTQVGSCASVLAILTECQYRESVKEWCPVLLMYAVLLDTQNGVATYGKTTPFDVQLLSHRGDPRKRARTFQHLQTLRDDQSAFTVIECLENDYKQHVHVGIAMLREPIFRFVKRPHFEQEVTSFVKRHHLEHLLFMTLFMDADGEKHRELALVSLPRMDDDAKRSLMQVLQQCKTLQWYGVGSFVTGDVVGPVYKQGNLAASRKKVMPLVQQWIAQQAKQE